MQSNNQDCIIHSNTIEEELKELKDLQRDGQICYNIGIQHDDKKIREYYKNPKIKTITLNDETIDIIIPYSIVNKYDKGTNFTKPKTKRKKNKKKYGKCK